MGEYSFEAKVEQAMHHVKARHRRSGDLTYNHPTTFDQQALQVTMQIVRLLKEKYKISRFPWVELEQLIENVPSYRIYEEIYTPGTYEMYGGGEGRTDTRRYTVLDVEHLTKIRDQLQASLNQDSKGKGKTPSKSQSGIGAIALTFAVAVVLIGVTLAAPFIVAALAGVSAALWLGVASAATLVAAAYFAYEVYLDLKVRYQASQLKEAEVRSLTTRIRARVAHIRLSVPQVADIAAKVHFPFLKPSVEKQVARERAKIFFGAAA
jgi:hypothetical protein